MFNLRREKNFIVCVFYIRLMLCLTFDEILNLMSNFPLASVAYCENKNSLTVFFEDASVECFFNQDRSCYTCRLLPGFPKDISFFTGLCNKYYRLLSTDCWQMESGSIEFVRDELTDYFVLT